MVIGSRENRNYQSVLDRWPALSTSKKHGFCFHLRDGSSGGGGDFIAGFLLGGALCGALVYIYAPQIRRSVRNEDEHRFQMPKQPVYQDDGLENARQTLNAKINQLNSAIDNVASRLKGDNNMPLVSAETDAEEATF